MTHGCTKSQRSEKSYFTVGPARYMERAQAGWIVTIKNFSNDVFIEDEGMNSFLQAELTGSLKCCVDCCKVYW